MYKSFLFLFLICFINSCSTSTDERKMSAIFHLIDSKKDVLPIVVTFNSDEIEIVNCDKQVYRLTNKSKVNLINLYFAVYGGYRSYLSLKIGNDILYDVAILAPNTSHLHCFDCPIMFVRKINKGLSIEDTTGTFEIYFDGIDAKYQLMKDSYKALKNEQCEFFDPKTDI